MMRLHAFTLLELLITMAVSAILMSMGYMALRIVQQQQHTAEHRLRELSQANTFQWLLARDFRRAQQVSVTAGELSCHFPGYDVAYLVQDSSVVRRQFEVTDTFTLPVLQVQYWLKGKPVSDTGSLLDEVSFTLRYRQDTLRLQACTWYAAEQLLLVTPISSATP
jgi:prepilin-type N-terminal cleavage/methylation domain-containing protein